jgi:serine/threonine protein kinase
MPIKTQLSIGQQLSTIFGLLTIKRFIASGGQGEVYCVEVNKSEYALKWYFLDKVSAELKNGIRFLISKGSPSNKFLWPLSLVEDNNNFGYVMELRTGEYKNMQDLMLDKFDMEIKDLLTACIELTDSFQKLHAFGLSYQDVSFGNVFINPTNGKILICDNDNVTETGKTVGSIMGTPKFMAPELVSGKAKFPNKDTDLFSETVLLFYMIMRGHPFDGTMEANIHCLDLPAQKGLYGEKAVFIFHPDNKNNRPIESIHGKIEKIWEIIPNYIQKLFIKTFTLGVNDVDSRSREVEWRKALIQFQNTVYRCPHCNKSEIIYDIEKIKNSETIVCKNCKKEASVPRLKINDYVVCLDDNRRISKEIISKFSVGDEKEVVSFNLYENRLFLTNKAEDVISIIRNNEPETRVNKYQKIEIFDKDKIIFSGVEGKIRF